MKKTLALLLCCVLTLGLFAACSAGDGIAPPFVSPADIAATTDAAASESAPDTVEESGINYKGLSSRSVTLDDVIKAEGREPDFEYAVDETTTYYIYNDVTLYDLTFEQMQVSFEEDKVRLSCTSTSAEGPSALVTAWAQSLSDHYGAPSESGGNYTWHDSTGNYLMLCVLNDTTAQLAFYLYAE